MRLLFSYCRNQNTLEKRVNLGWNTLKDDFLNFTYRFLHFGAYFEVFLCLLRASALLKDILG